MVLGDFMGYHIRARDIIKLYDKNEEVTEERIKLLLNIARIHGPAHKGLQYLVNRIENMEALMAKDANGMKTFINKISGLHCVICEREIIIGEFRYPTSTSGVTNRCSQCYCLHKIKINKNMEENKETELKAIQFLTSPFRKEPKPTKRVIGLISMIGKTNDQVRKEIAVAFRKDKKQEEKKKMMEITLDEFMQESSDETQPGVVTQIINPPHEPKENSEECKHNPKNSYALFCARSRLYWLKTTNPNIYLIYNEKGEFAQGVCDQACQKEIDEARRKGLKVELQNNLDEIRSLEKEIERLENTAKEPSARIIRKHEVVSGTGDLEGSYFQGWKHKKRP